MAKITRALQKLFGSSAAATELGKFGSLAEGTPEYATTPAEIQERSAYLGGWFDAIIGNNSPAIEDRNSLDYLFARQLAYLFQAGVPEWEVGTEYHAGSFCQVDGVIYVSLTDTNTGNEVSDFSNWTPLGNSLKTIRNITSDNSITFDSVDVSVADNTITKADHGLESGDVYRISTGGTLPTPLAVSTDYWVIKVDKDTFKIAAAFSDVRAGTEIDITVAGSGTQTFTSQNEWYLQDADGYDEYHVFNVGVAHTIYLPEAADSTPGKKYKILKADDHYGYTEIKVARMGAGASNGNTLDGMDFSDKSIYAPGGFAEFLASGEEIGVSGNTNYKCVNFFKNLRPEAQARTVQENRTTNVAAASVDVSENSFLVAANNGSWCWGDKIQLTTTGTLPAGLSLATDYWIHNLGGRNIKFATSLANLKTATYITITDQGSGSHTLNYQGSFEVSCMDGYTAYICEVDTADQTVNLPFSVEFSSSRDSINIKRDSGATNRKITIDPAGGNLINGVSTIELWFEDSVATISYDGNSYKSDKEQFRNDSLGGSWTGGTLYGERLGNMVSLFSDGALTHASSSSVAGAAGDVPTRFQPTASNFAHAVYYHDGNGARKCAVSDAGQLYADYYNNAGGGNADTDTLAPICMNYLLYDIG